MSEDPKKEYNKLFEQGKYIHTLQGVSALLDWDQETNMPEGASEIRSEQLKALAGIIHKEKVGKKFSGPLSKLIDLKTGNILTNHFSSREQSALREWRREYLIETCLPKKFVENFAKLTSESILAWRHARGNNDFSAFAPYLKKIISMNQKKADYIGYEENPYDALLDLYEPGMKTKTVDDLFGKLKQANVELLAKITKAPQVDDKLLYGNYPEKEQMEFSKKLLSAMGYNFTHGRLDLSTHPFSSATHPTDSRITTRLQPDYIFSCISTVLHEAGHSLYEMGLPIDQFGSPLGQSISMGIHESQSRFWETRIGLSKPFIEFVLPLLKAAFPHDLQGVDTHYCYRAINKVEPSFIRVEADEVTYPLHVILRFEMEKELIQGHLKVKDVPATWNEKMKQYLGITPPDNKRGCLQDVHWSMGAFGYFPTYALGNLYAAQIFKAFAKSHPDWEKRVAKGELEFIKKFLADNIFSYGKEFRSQELIHKITGRPFSPEDYITYLKDKYSHIYNISA